LSEFQIKFKRLKEYLKSKSLAAILLGKQYNFAWATGGKDNHVVKASEDGSCWLLFTTSNVYLIASNIEMPRLEAEEVSKLKMEKVSFPWYQKNLVKLVQKLSIDDKKTRSDTPGLGFELLPDDFNRLRYQFVLEEMRKLTDTRN
jgi:Xaa-Pro aminopeptidase